MRLREGSFAFGDPIDRIGLRQIQANDDFSTKNHQNRSTSTY
jgi:hypothetical protein